MAKQPFTNAELIEKIREAHIAMTSGHLADAIAYLAVVVNSVPPYRVVPAEDAARKVTPACTSKDPDKMCEKCNCWKMTRAYCS